MTRVLVTGCAGFIGSAFVRMLDAKSHKAYPVKRPELLIGLDAFRIGSSRQSCQSVRDFQIIEGDICDQKLVSNLIEKHKIDTVINFAAESHVDRSIEDSHAFVHSNVQGVVSLLEVIKTRAIRFVQVSTDEVYGSLGDQGSFTEESPLAPNSPYSASKTAADLFVRAFCHTHQVDALITRCSNNFGPFQYLEKFIPVVMKHALQNKKIPLYGTGKNVRDWIFVEDHAWGVYLATTKGKREEVYNFGGTGERDNLWLAKRILELIEKDEGLIEFVQDRKGHDWRYAIDASKAQKELGWKPAWNFEEALAYTVDWYQKEFSSL